MKEKTDFRFDKKAEKYDESYEGRLTARMPMRRSSALRSYEQ